MAELFRNLTHRFSKPIPRPQAQRFVLQTVISMFAEDMDLLPTGTVKSIVDDCVEKGQSSYDLFGGLFREGRGERFEMWVKRQADIWLFKGQRNFISEIDNAHAGENED